MITNKVPRTKEQEITLEELEYLSQFVTEEVPIFGEGKGGKISQFIFDYSKEQFELHNVDNDWELSLNPLKGLISIFSYKSKKEYLEILEKYSVNDLVKTSLQKIRLKLEGGDDFTKDQTTIQSNLDVSEFRPLKLEQEWKKKLTKICFDYGRLVDFKRQLNYLEGIELKTDWLKLIVENLEFEHPFYRDNFGTFVMKQNVDYFFRRLSEVCGGETEGLEFLKTIIPLGNILEKNFFDNTEVAIYLFEKIGVENFSKEEIIYLYTKVHEQMTSTEYPIIKWKYFWEHQNEIFSQKGITKRIQFKIQIGRFIRLKEYFDEDFDKKDNLFEKFILNNKYLDLTIDCFSLEDSFKSILGSGWILPLLELLEGENQLPDHIHFGDKLTKNKSELINFLESGLKLKIFPID